MFGKRKNNKDLIERFEVMSKEFLNKCRKLKRTERELKSLTRKIYNETNANYEFENQNLNAGTGLGEVLNGDLMRDETSINLEENESCQNKNNKVINGQSVRDDEVYNQSVCDEDEHKSIDGEEMCGRRVDGKVVYGKDMNGEMDSGKVAGSEDINSKSRYKNKVRSKSADGEMDCGKVAGGENVGNGLDSSKVDMMNDLDSVKESVLEGLVVSKESEVKGLDLAEKNANKGLIATKESEEQDLDSAEDSVTDIESDTIESGEAGGEFLDEDTYKIDLQKSRLIEEYLKNLASKNESQPVFLTGGSKKIVYQKQSKPPKNLKSAGEYVLKNYFK